MIPSPPESVAASWSAVRPFRGTRTAWIALILSSLVLATGCGYRAGAPFNPEIRSIYVPTFGSTVNRRGLEFQLTEAVQSQIKSRTHFRLVKEPMADTKLTGKLVRADKNLLGQTQFSDPRELQFNLAVEIKWEDLRTGQVLAQQRVPIAPDVVQQISQGEFAPEVGQSLVTAEQKAIDQLARDIVDKMEMPW
jgi:hypothetical protein